MPVYFEVKVDCIMRLGLGVIGLTLCQARAGSTYSGQLNNFVGRNRPMPKDNYVVVLNDGPWA